MSVLREVLAELFSMFAGDARLSMGALLVVGIAAATATVAPTLTPAVLLLGGLAVLVVSVLLAARRKG
jgi:hypothetical protein